MAAGLGLCAVARPCHVEHRRKLEKALTEAFEEHPDVGIITSFPGLGTTLGARLLGELGDDRDRFTSRRGLKAFAGTAPETRASGTRTSVTMRTVPNKRLNHAAYLWALPLVLHSPPARAHYDRRRQRGDSHTAASRNHVIRNSGCCTTACRRGSTSTARPTRPAQARTPRRHPQRLPVDGSELIRCLPRATST